MLQCAGIAHAGSVPSLGRHPPRHPLQSVSGGRCQSVSGGACEVPRGGCYPAPDPAVDTAVDPSIDPGIDPNTAVDPAFHPRRRPNRSVKTQPRRRRRGNVQDPSCVAHHPSRPRPVAPSGSSRAGGVATARYKRPLGGRERSCHCHGSFEVIVSTTGSGRRNDPYTALHYPRGDARRCKVTATRHDERPPARGARAAHLARREGLALEAGGRHANGKHWSSLGVRCSSRRSRRSSSRRRSSGSGCCAGPSGGMNSCHRRAGVWEH